MKIGLIDSGIGGLTILRAFIQDKIEAEYYYLADSAHMPYGEKSDAYILERINLLSEFLLTQYRIDALVIACNTATVIATTPLRSRYPHFPIIGIEPAVKPGVNLTKTNHIAIAATHSTLKSERLTALIDQFAVLNEVKVSKIEAGIWVKLIENGHYSKKETLTLIDQVLSPYVKSASAAPSSNLLPQDKSSQTLPPIDTLILGCTHFPFLADDLEHYLKRDLKRNIQLINPARAIVKQTLKLSAHFQLTPSSQKSHYHFYTTGAREPFRQHLSTLGFQATSLNKLTI